MDLTWYGQACFKIKGKNAIVVCDPYDPAAVGLKLVKLTADIVTVSHQHPDHNYVAGVTKAGESDPFVISGPGEYGTLGVSILGIPTYHDKQSGSQRGANTIYQIEIDGITILHCGDLGHKLTDGQLEELSDIDILLIPVGGVYTISYDDAAEVVSEIEPSMVIPMHYKVDGLKYNLDPVDKFLKEMGAEKIAPVPKLTVPRDKLPEETEVVVLERQ